MRGAPHIGFSLFMRRIKSRTSSANFGLRTLCRRDRHVQNRRYPARCQETTVSGLTRMVLRTTWPRSDERPTEQAIEPIQLGVRLFAFVHGKLLSKSSRLHCQTVPRDQERPHVRECREQSRNHHSDASRFRMSFKLLIREAAVVLMTDN